MRFDRCITHVVTSSSRQWSIRSSIFLRKIVSFTAWNTKRMFSVSTAVVKWWKKGRVRSRRRELNNSNWNFWTASNDWLLPLNCGKNSWILTRCIFCSSRSVLLRKRMMETLVKARLLTIVSKMLHDSTKRFVCRSSNNTWSNSLDAARNKIEVTPSKHWYHFCRCDRCPPTSTKWKGTFLIMNWCSAMPFVAFRQWRISCRVGK